MASYTGSNNGDVTGNHGGVDAWVMKLSATGTLQWQKALGGTGDDWAYSIQPTTDGGYIVAGYTDSNNGDATGNHGSYDAWVMKLSATGTLQWQKALGGTSGDYANSIQPTADGGYIVAGYTYSNDGDVTGNHGGYDAWVVKLSATGALQWQKALGGTDYDYAYSIQPTTDGGYIVAGYTSSYDGDVTGNHGSYDAWVMKLSATGTLQWQKSLGGKDYDYANSIQPTTDGGYIVAGYTRSNDGDVKGFHGGDGDAWVMKLSATGTLQWQKALGGTGYDSGQSIQPTTDGGYIVAGSTNSYDGDVTGNHGIFDAWVMKLSATGTLQWQKALGGRFDEEALSIQLTTDGGYIVAGYTGDSDDGDVTGYHGSYDAWVVKLGNPLATISFNNKALALYPNPARTILQLQTPYNTRFDKISIIDVMGKVIMEQPTTTNQVNVQNLAKGIYLLEAASGKEKFQSKFIKE